MFDPSTGALSGGISIDVHYYEDGNVRYISTKPINHQFSSPHVSASDIVKMIRKLEDQYQESLQVSFVDLAEGAFKRLRRALPVTRRYMEWDNIANYKVRR